MHIAYLPIYSSLFVGDIAVSHILDIRMETEARILPEEFNNKNESVRARVRVCARTSFDAETNARANSPARE